MASNAFSPITDLANSWYNKAKSVEDKIEGKPTPSPKRVSQENPAKNWYYYNHKQPPRPGEEPKAAPRKAAPKKRVAGK